MILIVFGSFNLGTKLLCEQNSSNGIRLHVAMVAGRFAEQ